MSRSDASRHFVAVGSPTVAITFVWAKELGQLRSAEQPPADAACLTDRLPLPADSPNSGKSGTDETRIVADRFGSLLCFQIWSNPERYPPSVFNPYVSVAICRARPHRGRVADATHTDDRAGPRMKKDERGNPTDDRAGPRIRDGSRINSVIWSGQSPGHTSQPPVSPSIRGLSIWSPPALCRW
jgi:hypothetical protein